jgi:hypothetical protein
VANKAELNFDSIVKNIQELMIEDSLLLRPLSLTDYPNIVNGTVLRVVERV